MPVFNCASTLARVLGQCSEQTHREIEIIVVNDGSSDATWDIAMKCAQVDPRIRVVNQRNAGIASALNRALALANGRYIARMDGDDYSTKNRIESQVSVLNGPNAPDICFTRAVYVDEIGGPYAESRQKVSVAEVAAALESGINPLFHGSVCMDRLQVERTGELYYRGHLAEDFDLWLRLLRKSRLHVIQDIHYGYLLNQSGFGARNKSRQANAVQLALQLAIERSTTGRESLAYAAETRRLSRSQEIGSLGLGPLHRFLHYYRARLCTLPGDSTSGIARLRAKLCIAAIRARDKVTGSDIRQLSLTEQRLWREKLGFLPPSR